MKSFLIVLSFAAVLLGAVASVSTEKKPIRVVQINAKWNANNTRTDLVNLSGCDYAFGWLEDQPKEVQQSIMSVPVVVIYNKDIPAVQYVADISLSLRVPFEEIQRKVEELK